MDDNFLYKLIDDSGRQFTNVHIFPYNGRKAVKVGFILFKGFYRFPPYLDLLCQFFLFCLIISGGFQEPFMTDGAADVILINALENTVEFGNAFFRLGNFTLAFLGLFSASWKCCFFAASSNTIASSKNSTVTSKICCKTNSFSVSSRIKCAEQVPVLLL